jgi:hypothetical protein
VRAPLVAAVIAAAALVGAVGCAARVPTPTDRADGVIRAIYAGDVVQTRAAFDPNVQPAITPSSIGRLSRRMQAIGSYQFLRGVSAMPNGRYDFEAQFDSGSMLVQMRLDPDGAIAALHVVPNEL